MGRRLLLVFAIVAAVVVLVLASSPWWLGIAFHRAGRVWGVSFASYERVGYTRFALHDVNVQRPGLRVTSTRAEATTPLVWLWRRMRGRADAVQVARWTVEVQPDPGRAAPARAESGWMLLRSRLLRIAEVLGEWLPRAQAESGTVHWPGGALQIEEARWAGRELTVEELAYGEVRVRAALAVPVDSDVLRLTVHFMEEPIGVALESRGAIVTGELLAWEQPAPLTARFGPGGWIPNQAELRAVDWRLPGSAVKLGGTYSAVLGDARVHWDDGQFDTAVTARGEPVGDEANVPPLAVDFRARGDTQAVTVEVLEVNLPGIAARLSEPVTVDRSGNFRDSAAQFGLQADLAEQPWFRATGAIDGEATIDSGVRARPALEFHLRARDVEVSGVEVSFAEALGQFDWPRVQVTSGTLIPAAGERLEWRGGWDFGSKEVINAAVSGRIRRDSLARWLPTQPQFEFVSVDAKANGAIAEMEHSGQARIEAVEVGGMKPLSSVAVEWRGRGAAAEAWTARAAAGATTLRLAGAADLDGVRLDEFDLVRAEAMLLRLAEPAELYWRPVLQLDALDLTAAESRVFARFSWGTSGSMEANLRNVPSDWLADFIELPGPPWRIHALAMTGKWDGGPMQFALTWGATVNLREDQTAGVNLAARGGSDGLHIEALRATENGVTIFNAAARIPLTVTPGEADAVHFDPKGVLAVDATAVPRADFWQRLGSVAGVELIDPRAEIHVAGTWERPEGEIRVQADRVVLDPKRFKREIPAIGALDVQLTGDRERVTLERFALSVEGQQVRASGYVPIPEEGWSALAKQPLATLEQGAEMNVAVPEAELAAFDRFLPAALAPVGTLQVEAAFRNGRLDGRVRLRDAASRPVGPIGVVQEINADVEADGRRFVLRSVSARSGGQPVTLTGSVEFPQDAPPRYDLVLRGNNLPFVRQMGLLIRGDLDLALRTPTAAAEPRISGTVRLRDSLFLRDVRALLPGGGAAAGAARRPPYFSVDTQPLARWQLDVGLVGDEFMRIRTPLFTGEASASLRLRGTLGEPRAIGQVMIDEGEVRMPFATFEVEQGTVRLTEENPHEPVIYLRGTTRRYGYDITMEVEGAATSPNVEFTSRPPLSSEQVLLLVTAGIAPSEEIAYTTTQRAARIGAYLGRSLLGSLGGPAGGADRLSIELGREISRQGRETYNIEYEVSDRWTALGEYNEFDEYSAGLRWRIYPRRTDRERELRDRRDVLEPTGERRAAGIDVRGVGWLKNRELRISLERILDQETGVLGANAIEDASVILLSALVDEGFQEPRLEIEARLRDGERQWHVFDPTFARPLPRSLAATAVEFHLTPGTRWFIDEVNFAGLTELTEKQARALFRPEQTLFATARTNAYSPSRVNRGESTLLGELEQRGYIEATVRAEVAREVDGAVTLDVHVEEGPRWEVRSLRYQNGEYEDVELPDPDDWTGQPLAPAVQQDLREAVRHAYYRAGHPDVGVHVYAEPIAQEPGRIEAELVVTIVPGPHVTIGEVRFEGNERTKRSVLRRRVQLESGDPLNPFSLERARYRISRLGVFESVDLQYEPTDGTVRDPVFVVREGLRREVALLMGYGSYEQLRAGVEMRQMNLFRMAHQGRLTLVQSMKSTSTDFTYGVPELFGETLDGSAQIYALRREEIAFLREEYGTSFTLRRAVPQFGGEALVRYTFEALRNRPKDLSVRLTDDRQINVASLSFALTGDTRDNPLRPRRGYNWSVRFEAANPTLGGNATYQRAEVAGGYHTSWGSGRWVRAGLSHGVITTYDGDDSTLPVNRRFFPGGDNSLRGYQSGEAAPRGADGRFIGAKSFLLMNLELEQSLMPNWSVVAFLDGLGTAAVLRDYPIGERLYSTGLGLRYQTLIGPIRLEYGRNLNPRPRDPSGTWHFSVGYPF